MHAITPCILLLLALTRTATAMTFAALFVLLIAIWAVKSDFVRAVGIEKAVTLSNLCYALPLAVFGAEHFLDYKNIMQIVPRYMPFPLFWTFFVGLALIAAALSIAARVQVRWSGLLFGIMMFSFDAMLTVPALLGKPHDRFSWIFLFRESQFGAGAWCLAAAAMQMGQARKMLTAVSRIIIGVGATFYGVEHFLNRLNVPGVPLEKIMPTWIPARPLISYLTGAILALAGAAILFTKKRRTAAAYAGAWILFIVLVIYGPIMIAALMDPRDTVQVEGLNYFFDTLLYAGAILALARAMKGSEAVTTTTAIDSRHGSVATTGAAPQKVG